MFTLYVLYNLIVAKIFNKIRMEIIKMAKKTNETLGTKEVKNSKKSVSKVETAENIAELNDFYERFESWRGSQEIIKKNIYGMFVIEVNKANPNGDPMREGAPRVDYKNYGEISGQCMGNKIRKYMSKDLGKDIYVLNSEVTGDKCMSLHERFARATEGLTSKNDKVNGMCMNYYDVPVFGFTAAFSGSKGKKASDETVCSAEENAVSCSCKAAVTLKDAVSIKPVVVTRKGLTKNINSENEDKKGSDTMGSKYRVEHGVYVGWFAVEGWQADKNSFSRTHLNDFVEALGNMFESDPSTARPMGSINTKKVVVWEAENGHRLPNMGHIMEGVKVSDDGKVTYPALEGVNITEF